MPYIKKENRKKFDKTISELSAKIAAEGHALGYQTLAGNLNYAITTLLQKTYRESDDGSHTFTLSYSDYNEMIGILECAKLELYRKHAAPYEEQKIEENGDVFPNDEEE